jgi:carboxyl-terminal processing protease
MLLALLLTNALLVVQAPSQWTAGPPTHTDHAFHVAVACNGKLYLLGGDEKAEVEVFDPRTTRWQKVGKPPHMRMFPAAAALGAKIYLAGGLSDPQVSLASMDVLDTTNHTWSKAAPMQEPRSRFALVTVNGKLYAIGGIVPGHPGKNGDVATVEEYDPATDRWSFKTEMPTRRHGHGAVTVGNKVIVVGGFGETGKQYGPLRIVEEYDPAANRWTRKPEMPTPRGFLGLAAVGDKLFAVGGHYHLEAVESYDLRTETWQRLPPLPHRLTRFGMTALEATLYAVGGEDSPRSVWLYKAIPGWQTVGARILEIVRTHFLNADKGKTWAEHYHTQLSSLTNSAEFVSLTKNCLASLGTSHTGYYTPDDPEYYGLQAIFRTSEQEVVEYDSIGVDVTADGFVRVVFAGGPAQQAGLRRGDKLLLADGQPFHRIRSYRGKSGKKVTLTVQREKGSPTVTVEVTPRRINPKQEWLEAQKQGTRLISHQGKSIAYVPMFSCAGEEFAQALQDALRGELRQADALILDFRDGWGGANPDFVNLFSRTAPVLTQIDRNGQEWRYDTQWRKPVVLLINGGSRSGKEVVAFAFKKHRLGMVVGERTAGAVVAGRCFRLPDDSLLYLAVRHIRVDGANLEGVGVAPDVHVPDVLPFANSRDAQLTKALDLAAK